MKPGKELDILISEKVLNLVPCDAWKIQCYDVDGPTYFKDTCSHGNSGCYPEGSPFGYSTSMDAAWQVLEKLHEDTDDWTLVSTATKGRWLAYEATGCADPDFGRWCEYGETAPHAICLAALAAVEILRGSVIGSTVGSEPVSIVPVPPAKPEGPPNEEVSKSGIVREKK